MATRMTEAGSSAMTAAEALAPVATSAADNDGVDTTAENDDDELQGEESCSEKKYFDERAQVMELLMELLATELPSHESDVDAAFEHKFKTITTIVRSCNSIYQCGCQAAIAC